jgi:electron transport complex protein RnfA
MVSNELSWYFILLSALLINNIVLLRFLALCSFFGVSSKVETSIGMGIAVMFVMVMACSISWAVYYFILDPLGLEFLRTTAFILSIASLVQLEELYIRKMLPALYKQMGIFLPLITTNCAILGGAFLAIDYKLNFVNTIIYAIGVSGGFVIAIILFAGIRERIELAPVPHYFKGYPIAFITASLMSLAFLGFSHLFGL